MFFHLPLGLAANYLVLERVPLLVAITMFLLAWIGKRPGLLDVTPLSMFVVSLAATGCGEAVAVTARLIFVHASQRIPGLIPFEIHAPQWFIDYDQAVVSAVVALPLLIAVFVFSSGLKRSKPALAAGAAGGLAVVISGCHFLRLYAPSAASAIFKGRLDKWLIAGLSHGPRLFAGYAFRRGSTMPDFAILDDHLAAFAAFALTGVIYAILGVYGRRKLGRAKTVPALCSAVMIVMLLCWSLGALSFFFDAYRIPVTLVLAFVALITAQSKLSDHYYDLHPGRSSQAPTAHDAIAASGAERVIVVAANGGGIQAAAWAGQVLAGLDATAPGFRKALRMISSVSGGSVGSAMFIAALANGAPEEAIRSTAESSLDEVAWGLAWPDFLIGLCPWVFGRIFTIGRGRALELAWVRNSGPKLGLQDNLSKWNQRVSSGELPAVVMNATIVDSGARLLFGTTRFGGGPVRGRARLEAAKLYGERDVSVVTGARLSASFPYVTPASRADSSDPQPHIVDGGYYDSYGMATLVEWLDEALRGQNTVKSVLVLQVHGAPVESGNPAKPRPGSRGWFYQAYAPVEALINVRSAGQVAHNDVELALLQQDWGNKGIPIHSLPFEFPDPKAPLSWHLTSEQQEEIRKVWEQDEEIQKSREGVEGFLAGQDVTGCTCPSCRKARPVPA